MYSFVQAVEEFSVIYKISSLSSRLIAKHTICYGKVT